MIYLASLLFLASSAVFAVYGYLARRDAEASLARANQVYEASMVVRESAALAYLLASEITRHNAQLAPVTVRGNAIGEPS